jgi:ABC-type uncharacterized transport system involved in gliding motility auxiliary subunit
VAGLLAVNALAANLWLDQIGWARVDLTHGRLYTLSESTHNYLSQLQEPLLIRGYFSAATHPLLAPLARQAFAALSKNRYRLSSWLNTEDPEEIAGELRQVELEPCALPAGDGSLSNVREYLQ